MTTRIHPRGIDGGGGTTATPTLLPLTTEIGGVPDLVWDDNNNLVYTEEPS